MHSNLVYIALLSMMCSSTLKCFLNEKCKTLRNTVDTLNYGAFYKIFDLPASFLML